MVVESDVWEKSLHDLTCCSTTESLDRPCLRALASVRSLIVNHSTTEETISHVLELLVRNLRGDQDPFHNNVLRLLSDLALHRDLSHVIFDRVYAYFTARKDSSRLTAQAIIVLVTIAEHCRGTPTMSKSYDLNEYFFHLLCSSPSASVRAWVLFHANKFHVGHCRLIMMLLKLTKDTYPYVRRAALYGLVRLTELTDSTKRELIQSCYDSAVELLHDTNESVRSVAVHVVSAWGHTLATLDNEVGNMDRFDAVFVQLCAMVRDMSVGVRIEAFSVLGNFKLVSENILLQTLSKRIKNVIKDRKIADLRTSKEFDLSLSDVAGIFVHGCEDEFNEVRMRACMSLGKLSILSSKFAEDALDFLMDMLNDDTVAVRLQCLQTMHHMVTLDRLKVQESHMHVFLGTLVDSNSSIRCATRKVLRLMKLRDVNIFKLVAKGLLTNTESFPEDEVDILNVLFNIGRHHDNFAGSFVMEIFQEIEPSCQGQLHSDGAKIVALLVLAIGSSFTNEKLICSIPTRLSTYAVPFLGRISRSLREIVCQDTLLAYLSQCSNFVHSPIGQLFRPEDLCSAMGEISNNSNEISKIFPLRQISYETSEVYQNDHLDLTHTMSVSEYQQKLNSIEIEESQAIGLVLKTVAETWPLIKSGCMDEVQKTLRSCKEELGKISVESNEVVGLLAFACQYVRIIRLLGRVWEQIFPPKRFRCCRSRSLDLLLEKLDLNVKRMRYGFLGFSNEVELHLTEFMILTCVLRLCNGEVCCRLTILERMRSMLYVEVLCDDEVIQMSDFLKQLKSSSPESTDNDASYLVQLKSALDLFSLKQVRFTETLKHIKAELDVQDNNSENPLPFISGLPAGITFQITVHNVFGKDRLWLKMAVEGITEYVFLDFMQFEDYNFFRKATLTVPFYQTPKAVSFSMRACVCKECPFVDVQRAKFLGGPKRELTFLSSDKEIYFALRN